MVFPAASLLAAVAAPGGAATPVPPDIRGIVPPQPYFLAGNPLFLILAGLCVLLAGVVAWYFIFRRPAPKPGPRFTPREVAERRLRELAARVGSLDARAFGNEVADVLREYIGGQFQLHPERQTSQEFLSSVSDSRAFTKTEHVLLADFLEGCDLLKFARADATLDRKQYLLAQAADFVQNQRAAGRMGKWEVGSRSGGSQTQRVSTVFRHVPARPFQLQLRASDAVVAARRADVAAVAAGTGGGGSGGRVFLHGHPPPDRPSASGAVRGRCRRSCSRSRWRRASWRWPGRS